jgi:hypothetical protein
MHKWQLYEAKNQLSKISFRDFLLQAPKIDKLDIERTKGDARNIEDTSDSDNAL